MRPPGWFSGTESRAAHIARLPLVVLSWLYAAGARGHRWLYERGWRRRVRLSCRVVSVGNLTVGGSGKTPTAAWIAVGLRRRGYRVAIATRGYGRLGRERVEVVSDGRKVLSRLERAGDEPLVLAAHAPGVPVLVGPRRDVVGLRAVSAFGAQVLVLDDGFQHHRLARDVDIVLLDAGSGPGNRSLLPRGPFREPLAALGRAHAIGVVDGDLDERDESAVLAAAPAARRFRVERRPSGVRSLDGGRDEPPESLAGVRVGMLCGLANPEGFHRTLEKIGATVVAQRVFADHHHYAPRDLAGLGRETSVWITTEKDAVKILPRWALEIDLRVLRIEARVEEGGALLDWLETRLRSRPRGRDAALPAA